MSDKQMIIMYKILRWPFYLGQIILLVYSIYLNINKVDNWFLPIGLLFFQQIVFWIGYIYYSKKLKK